MTTIEPGGRLREKCGVFGIFAPGEDVARITFFGLYSLQHRGQESAGIAVSDGEDVRLHKDMGLVSQIFNEADLAPLRGFLAVGHTRYSTTGSSSACNAQPVVVESDLGPVVLAHNGNLTNTIDLREEVACLGIEPATATDSELAAHIIANASGRTLPERLRDAMPRLIGAYSFVLATRNMLVGVRDPHGVRPLVIGRLGEGWVLASETCALDTIGADPVREVQPGEIVWVDGAGLRCMQGQPCLRPALCVFEYIYFARADSVMNGGSMYAARVEMGRQLAREHPADADLVISVPDSANAAAIGYAQELGLPFSEGLIKSRYIGRTFIQADQRTRERAINMKFNPLPDVLSGKRLVVVDDSIVRGPTSRRIVRLLRRAGAKAIHLRISSPPMTDPCYLGLDTGRRSELIASRMSVPEICQYVGADTLGYLSLDGLIRAINRPGQGFCTACFTGDYPVPVQLEFDKLALERRERAKVAT